ncbi:MAG: retropepsin-like aspartic protease [Fulvivirga sp.]
MQRAFFTVYAAVFLLACSGGNKWVETKASREEFVTTIPVDMNLELMFTEVVIEDKKYRFLIDTGAPFAISPEIAKAIGFKASGSNTTNSSGLKKGRLQYGKIKEARIGNMRFSNITTYVIDFKRSILLDCLDFDGIVGANLMNCCVWQINPIEKTVTFTNDINKLDHIDDAYSLNMKKVGGQKSPYIPIQFNEADPGHALFDTGSGHYFTITYTSYLAAKKDGRADDIEFVQGRGLGSAGVFGSDDTTQFEIKLNRVQIGKELLENIVTDMSHTDKTKVGMKFVKGRIVTLDFPGKRFFIKKTPTANLQNQLNTFGISIRPDEVGNMIIGSVYDNSPAAQKFIRPSNKILAIDDLEFTSADKSCDYFFLARQKLIEQNSIKLLLADKDGQREVTLQKSVLLD